MKYELKLKIGTQPTETSCGPTCLVAVYDYWDQPTSLETVIDEIGQLGSGGTLAVNLACHALSRGFSAEIVTYNLQLFDPTWFDDDGQMHSANWMVDRLNKQLLAKQQRSEIDVERLHAATNSYLQFLDLGGMLRMQPLEEKLLVATLTSGTPILGGLSATYLYNESRERPSVLDGRHTSLPDDVLGDPTGHFVVLHGYEAATQSVSIADPLHPNPMAPTNKYRAPLSRVASAIMLGIITYDANLLIVRPNGIKE